MPKFKLTKATIKSSFQNNARRVSRRYLPRWTIFAIDIVLLNFASLVYYLIIVNLNVDFYPALTIAERFGLQIVIYTLFFYKFKTYSGIVRHSTLYDGFNLFKATSCALLTLALFNYSSLYFYGTKIYLMPGLLMHFFITFIFLISFRILIKVAYQVYVELGKSTRYEKVVVFGTDDKAVALANALLMDVDQKYKLVAFIEPNKNNFFLNETLLNLPVLAYKKTFFKSMSGLGATTLILTPHAESNEQRDRIIHKCLERGIKLLTVPLISDWEDVKNIAKKIKTFEIQDLLERKPIELATDNISSTISDQVVLVTGAAGSIGSEIVRQLLLFEPKAILLLDQAETPLHDLDLELKKSTKILCLSILADIRDKKQLEYVFREYQPNLVFHAAAYKHVPLMEGNPIQAVQTNVIGTKNLADLAVAYGVSRFVMVSTDKAVNPTNVMGASKRIAEKYVQSYALDFNSNAKLTTKFITTRFGNVLGSNGSVVPLFEKQITAGGPVTVTHPEVLRYFMTIPEACQLVLEAGAMGNGGEIYIFDMGQPVRIVDLAEKMIRLAGFVPYKDIAIQFTGLRPGEKLYEELLHDSSTTLPTHHEKIMVCRDSCADFNGIKVDIEDLVTIAEQGNVYDLVAAMKQIVPEFKSKNSAFEQLDA